MPAQLQPAPKGSSRFDVLFCNPKGTKKQRKWVDGKLTVSFNSAYLYDTENDKCVTCLKGTGLYPNSVFQRMESAHGGSDWYAPGTELTVGCFLVQIETVMELHLIPLPEVTEERKEAQVVIGLHSAKRKRSRGESETAAVSATDCDEKQHEGSFHAGGTLRGSDIVAEIVPNRRSHVLIQDELLRCSPQYWQ